MTRASTDLTGKASPLRFYAPRMRGGRARCADQVPLAASRIAGRSFSGVPNNPHARRQVNGHSRKRVRRIRIPRARERPVTSSNTASPIRRLMPGHAPSRSLARCSATSAPAFAAWPDERVLPSCIRPAALVGFLFCEMLNTTGLRPSPKLLLPRLVPTYLPWA